MGEVRLKEDRGTEAHEYRRRRRLFVEDRRGRP